MSKVTLDSLAKLRDSQSPPFQGKVEVVEMTACPKCDRLYRDESDASDCCMNDFDEYFVCPVCTEKTRGLDKRDEFERKINGKS